MGLGRYRIDGEKKMELKKMPTGCKEAGLTAKDKAEYQQRTAENLQKIAVLQEKLYAEGREGIVVVLQAMDAAGKDSMVKHVMTVLNPQGVSVTSFKQPNAAELSHDYLWRAGQALPARGHIAIFNRSYYEDVLVVRVHQMQKNYKMAARCLKGDDFFEKRYRQIRGFEEYLYDNSYRVVKMFLNVSQETQKKRFMERIDDPAKNWKFSSADLEERKYWPEYQNAYQAAINATATEHSPWYILPADQKWYTRYLASELMVQVLQDCDPAFPALPQAEKERLAACKALLQAEDRA